jgi:hypothetical protein
MYHLRLAARMRRPDQQETGRRGSVRLIARA